jgi:tetrahydromethanopterin S-methyltransferase subunit E
LGLTEGRPEQQHGCNSQILFHSFPLPLLASIVALYVGSIRSIVPMHGDGLWQSCSCANIPIAGAIFCAERGCGRR